MSISSSDKRKRNARRKKLSLKLVRLKRRLIFLNNCLQSRLIPPSIIIKQRYTFPGANALYSDFSFRLLSCIIRSTSEKLQSTRQEFEAITSELEQLGFIVPTSSKVTRCLNRILVERHLRKFSGLYFKSLDSKQPIENQYRFCTSIDLPDVTTIRENLGLRKSLCNKRKDILLQRVRVLASINFLTNCVKEQVVPNSIRIKRCHRFLDADILYDEFDRELCNAILEAKLKYYDEINDFLGRIDEILDENLRLKWCNDECEEVQKLTNKLRQKHDVKLHKLKCHRDSYMHRTSCNSQPISSMRPLVYNFSKHKLTNNETNLLVKGHGFILNQSPNSSQIKCAVSEFNRTVRLAMMHEDSTKPIPRYFIRSQYMPSQLDSHNIKNTNIGVEDFLTELENKSKESSKKEVIKYKNDSNIRQALHSLRTDGSIVIQSADKGQSFVILDKDYYSNKVTRMLTDPNYYKRYELTYHCQNTVDQVIELFRNMPLRKTKKFIQDYDVQTPFFYGLPKIHKSKIIENELSSLNSQSRVFERNNPPDDLPFRPIVASTRGPTQQLARIVNGLLQPFLEKVPSYIQSYQDFIKKISPYRHLTPGTLLCTFDIKDLYTNINHTLAIKAITFWMNKHPNLTEQTIRKFLADMDERCELGILDTSCLVTIIARAVRLILNNNIFLFDGEHYQQIKGIAMGSSFAPTIANLTVGYLETRLYTKVRKLLGKKIELYVREHWFRYIDDCQLLWPFGIERLDRFTDILQTLAKDIVFTREISNVKLPFLNIMLEIKKDELELDVYYKPTHTFAYLHFHSSHPRHIKRRIPYILAKIICSIVTNTKVRRKRLVEMKQYLRGRSYPDRLINDAIKSIENEELPAEHAVKPLVESKKQRFLSFRILHNRNNVDLYPFVYEKLPLALGEKLAKKFVSRKVNLLPPNLKRLLTSSRFYHKSQAPPNLPSPCQRNGCQICGRIISTSSHDAVTCNAPIDCTSRFVAYRLDCKACKQSSFGRTCHLKKVRQCSGCGSKKFRLFPFHKMHTDRVVPQQLWLEDFLKKREKV